MMLIDIARLIIPDGIFYQEIPVSTLINAKRQPTPAFWPEGKGNYKAGIVIPEIAVEDSITVLHQAIPDDPCILSGVENLLRRNHLLANNEPIDPELYAVFSILHELGHWFDFQTRYASRGLSGNEFNSDYNAEMSKLELGELEKLIKMSEQGADEFFNNLTLFHKKYREHPFEVIADQYAIEKLNALK